MVGEVAKRVVNVVVLLLAAVAFFEVPLGGKTPAQHVAAIFATAPAREAADAAAGAGKRIVTNVKAPRPAPKAPAPAPPPQPAQEELEPAD